MGVDAIAAIGVRIPAEKLKTEIRPVRKRIGPTKWPDNYRYDPETGEPLWTTVPETVGPHIVANLQAAGLFVRFYQAHGPFTGPSHAIVACSEFAVLVVDCDSEDTEHAAAKLNFDTDWRAVARDRLQAILEPMGLWDPDEFGLHLVVDA